MLFLTLGEYPSLGPDVDRKPPRVNALSDKPEELDGLLFGLKAIKIQGIKGFAKQFVIFAFTG
jgi:hypothetical protein